jgi:hypothetical protein
MRKPCLLIAIGTAPVRVKNSMTAGGAGLWSTGAYPATWSERIVSDFIVHTSCNRKTQPALRFPSKKCRA